MEFKTDFFKLIYKGLDDKPLIQNENKEINNIIDLILKERNVLVFGDVQSGKTERINRIRKKIFDDKIFDVIIFLGGTNSNLLDQSESRALNEIKYTNDVIHIYHDRVENLSISNEYIYDIITMKQKFYLDQILNVIKFISDELKVLIIDDESDYASINTGSSKNVDQRKEELSNQSEVNKILSIILERENSYLCSFTATPYANIANKKNGLISPKFIYRLKNNSEYTGIDFFEKIGNIVYSGIEEKKEDENLNRGHIIESIKYFIFHTAVYNCNFEKRNFELLINIDSQTSKMDTYFKIVKNIIKNEIPRWGDGTEEIFFRIFSKINEEWKVKNPSIQINIKMIINEIDLIIESLILKSKQIITKLYGKNNKYRSPNELSEPKIIISGIMASRGFTFSNLLVELLLNGPNVKGKIAADTLAQRARWFGYRKQYFNYMKILIDFRFLKGLKEIDKINKNIGIDGDTIYPVTEKMIESINGFKSDAIVISGGKKIGK